MQKIAILTDSNSGITPKEAQEAGVFVLPTPVYIDDRLYYEGVDISNDEFYERQAAGANIKTSMPVVGEVMDEWDRLLEEHDQVIYIPLSSGLSASCQTAEAMAEEDEYDGRVFVVDNRRISVTMKLSVYEAKKLADEGKDAPYIKDFLERTAADSYIYLMVDTLEYLKKGGRITPAAAAIGSMLRIKPVLSIYGDKLDSFAKARTAKQAKEIMIEAIMTDLKEKLKDPEAKDTIVSLAYTRDREPAEAFREELQELFPSKKITVDPLSLVVACHTGPGAIGITVSRSLIKEI